MVLTTSQTDTDKYFTPRKSYAKIPQILEIPNLVEVQLNSFRWFQEEGLRQLLEEISPIQDFTGNRLELSFLDYEFRPPRHTEQECRHRDLTYSAQLYVKARLLVKATGEIKEEDLFFGTLPLMTANGTFITSGAERVVVSQLLRSPGVFFTEEEDAASGRGLCHAKLIPTHGAWLEVETSNRNLLSAKIDGKRRIPITTLLRAIGYSSDTELTSLFADVDNNPDHQYIRTTMERDTLVKNQTDALMDIFKRLRPGEPVTPENSQKLIKSLFFDPQRYDLGEVGRYKLNTRLGLADEKRIRVLDKEDLVAIIANVIKVNNGKDNPDDIDHLGNRRVCTIGELIQNQFRIGLLRLERIVRERMSIIATEGITPSALVNIRPIVASVREFFGSSQLSQFMDQTNPLAELTHKRRLSAMGPGGLSRERAGFEVRDVHFSHYGRICPIETPEGPNIGLIGSLATYSRINRYGFIETPYRKVYSELPSRDERLIGQVVRETVKDKKGNAIAEAGVKVTPELATKLTKHSAPIKVMPFVSYEIIYFTADHEEKRVVAQANARLDDKGHFLDARVEARHGEQYLFELPEKIELMDVSPKQIVSVSAALIPFLEHDDANRALMGANMQRQAVPLIRPTAPIVATGIEREAARYSGEVLHAINPGTVTSVTSSEVVVTRDKGEQDTYPLFKFVRTNQGTCINQNPVVDKGDRVETGQVLANGSSTDRGELALGHNLRVAFMSWSGYNYEDAVVISSRLVRDDRFTSIHLSKHEVEARDTKLGPEEITRDIPNVGEESLRELDEYGIVRVGADVSPGDILVGKITPKGETELSAEEKLLRAIFGEKAREVKDTSLRMPHGEWGKVINVKVFSTTNGDDLPAGVNEWVQVWVAQKRKVSVGDKLAGRHGNKGVVSIIAPAEDMPFLPDGTPVDVVINPIDVPSRMNLGQILETHLGLAAQTLGMKVMTPVFDGADDSDIEDALARAWLAQKAGAVNLDPTNGETSQVDIEAAKAWVTSTGYDGEQVFSDSHHGVARDVSLRIWLEDLGIPSRDLSRDEIEDTITRISNEKNLPPPILGKAILRDGRTGTPFDHPITVGCVYMMKLNHMVEDKVHARSTGPYSLISQQPLGGKAQFGGQRFGEMEVWALEAYGAAHNLQEMLTIKSDDVTGRAKTYEAIVKNENILQSGVPESFKVLIMELRSLGLAVEVLSEEEKLTLPEKSKEPTPVLPELPELKLEAEASGESTHSEEIEENA